MNTCQLPKTFYDMLSLMPEDQVAIVESFQKYQDTNVN